MDKITVSSLDMARYFAAEWEDITVAFPVNILEIDTINELAEKIRLTLLVESKEAIQFLQENLKYSLGFFIKIDVGTHRTGIDPENKKAIEEILSLCSTDDKLQFKGFLAHAGHSYQCRSRKEIQKVFNETALIMAKLKAQYIHDYPDLLISVGDTPGCSVVSDFPGIDEIRPGNFVFYDLMQVQIGCTDFDHIAVAMACPIVAIHESRNEMVVYGGGVHFAKDRLEDEKLGVIYGRVVKPKNGGWGKIVPGMYLRSLSQEHGIVVVPEGKISKYKIGDYLLVLPVHSCMSADLLRQYLTTEGHWIRA
jgi:D-serine deaminase-like pyridoxal phosphate-dependent protein